ncbi:MAG: hypothetical protein ACOCUA_00745 [archaeon]
MATTESTPPQLPIPADVTGGGVIVLLALLQTLLLDGGGIVTFTALLVVWPLVGGAAAAFFSARPSDRPVDGAVAGAFASLTVTLLVLLTGLAGAWPGFVTTNLGVSLWPVTFATLVGTSISWTVFGYLGAAAVDRAV